MFSTPSCTFCTGPLSSATLTAAGETGRPLFPLYHPASLIYNRALAPVYEQDVRALADSFVQNTALPTAQEDGQ